MMGLLSGKTAIITGASKGIGKSIAEVFAGEGCRLVLLARNKALLEELCSGLNQKYGTGSLYREADTGKPDSMKSVFAGIYELGIFPEILVNNAGIMVDSTLQMVKPEMIEETFAVNTFGAIYCSQLALKGFLRNKKGCIINLSSIIGTQGSPGQSIYGASKAAIIGFTKSLSKELAPLNIRVNAIAPGFIDTDMTKGRNEKFYEKNLASIGMKRFGRPEDVASVALFLASDLSGYVTGQIIGVDGSMVI
jgi:3-oxoacyl-[acyl-carrier protein] reductase